MRIARFAAQSLSRAPRDLTSLLAMGMLALAIFAGTSEGMVPCLNSCGNPTKGTDDDGNDTYTCGGACTFTACECNLYTVTAPDGTVRSRTCNCDKKPAITVTD